MIAILFKNFLRSKGLMLGLLILFTSGLISLNFGENFLEKTRQSIRKTADYQQESIERYVKFESDDIGLLLYYLRFGLVNEIPNLAALSIGQRDVNPSIQSVTIRNLEEQKYNTDLMNPMYQLIGNLDFSFVLIYLFPLVIIAFCYNLISEEKEGGTWSLVLSHVLNPMSLLRVKLAIRYASIVLVLFLLLIIAKFYLNIRVDRAFIAFSLASLFYISFWFCLAWLVISFHKYSSQNASMLLISWVMLAIVIPTFINALLVNRYPVPEAFQTVIESRDGYHKKWDEPKEPTIQKFHRLYPQFSQFQHPEKQEFSWLWYYAMQQMGDEQSAEQSEQLKEKLRKREGVGALLGAFVPTVHTQLTLNSLCLTGLQNQLHFLEKLEAFHEQKRLYFYPKIFTNAPVTQENWKDFSVEYFHDKTASNWLKILLPVIAGSLICLFWAQVNFRKTIG